MQTRNPPQAASVLLLLCTLYISQAPRRHLCQSGLTNLAAQGSSAGSRTSDKTKATRLHPLDYYYLVLLHLFPLVKTHTPRARTPSRRAGKILLLLLLPPPLSARRHGRRRTPGNRGVAAGDAGPSIHAALLP